MKLIKEQCAPFWGTEEQYGFLSNFYEMEIPVIDEIKATFIKSPDVFHSSEQLYMLLKAMYFKDFEIAQKILLSKKPIEAKKLGRQIKNFDTEAWMFVRDEYMVDALLLKFGDNSELGQKLIDLRGMTLIEASPSDCVWGIGLEESELIYDTDNWRGANLLGTCLMYVRDVLYASKFT